MRFLFLYLLLLGTASALDYGIKFGGRSSANNLSSGVLQDGGLNHGTATNYKSVAMPTLSWSLTVSNDTGSSQDVVMSFTRHDVDDSNHHVTSMGFSPSSFTIADGATQVVTVNHHASAITRAQVYGDDGLAYHIPSTNPYPTTNPLMAVSTLTIHAGMGSGSANLEVNVSYYGKFWYSSPNSSPWGLWETSEPSETLNLAAGAPPTEAYNFRAFFAKGVDETVTGTVFAFDGTDYRQLTLVNLPKGMVGEGVNGQLHSIDFTFDLASNEEVVIVGDNGVTFTQNVEQLEQTGEFLWTSGDGYVEAPGVNSLFYYVHADEDNPFSMKVVETGEDETTLVGSYKDSTGTEVTVDLSEVTGEIDDFSATQTNTSTTNYGDSAGYVAGSVEAPGETPAETAADVSSSDLATGLGDLQTGAKTKGQEVMDALDELLPPSDRFNVDQVTEYQWVLPALFGFNPDPITIKLDYPIIALIRSVLLFMVQVGYAYTLIMTFWKTVAS